MWKQCSIDPQCFFPRHCCFALVPNYILHSPVWRSSRSSSHSCTVAAADKSNWYLNHYHGIIYLEAILFRFNYTTLFCCIQSLSLVQLRTFERMMKAWNNHASCWVFHGAGVSQKNQVLQISMGVQYIIGWPWFAWAAQEFSDHHMGACCDITKLKSTHINPALASHAELKANIGLSL